MSQVIYGKCDKLRYNVIQRLFHHCAKKKEKGKKKTQNPPQTKKIPTQSQNKTEQTQSQVPNLYETVKLMNVSNSAKRIFSVHVSGKTSTFRNPSILQGLNASSRYFQKKKEGESHIIHGQQRH